MIRQSEADLEITERTLDLYVKDKYKLNIKLPYEIIEDEGTATFDRKNRNLVLNLPVVPQKEILVETSKDDENIPIEVIDENGNPIKTEENNSEINKEQNENNKKEEKKVENSTEKITDYTVVLYENAKIPKSKIHQTMDQLEILLYIPEVILSSIETKFLGNTFYLEAQSKENNQLYQYLIRLANSINIEECGFMVVDVPNEDNNVINQKSSQVKEKVKAVKCILHKFKSEWWSNNVFEIKPKLILESETKIGKETEENENKNENDIDNLIHREKHIDYIYKDGETNNGIFEFNEKIFLTELFVNKLDEYLTKQENEPKNKKEDEIPQWLRDAINPPKPSEKNKVIELTEEELLNTTTEENSTEKVEVTKNTEPEITLKANDIIFDLDDIDF